MQIMCWSWSISCIYSWLCRHLTWTEWVNVRISEWESPINRFNYVRCLRHFPGRCNQHVSSLSPTERSSVWSPITTSWALAVKLLWHLPETGALKVVRSPSCNVPFFFSSAGPSEGLKFCFHSLLSSVPDFLPDIPDHWSHLVLTSLISRFGY